MYFTNAKQTSTTGMPYGMSRNIILPLLALSSCTASPSHLSLAVALQAMISTETCSLVKLVTVNSHSHRTIRGRVRIQHTYQITVLYSSYV